MPIPTASGGCAPAASLRALAAMSPSSWRHVALPLGALALQTALFEVVEFEMLARRETDLVGSPYADSGAALFVRDVAPLLLPILVAGFLALRLRARGRCSPRGQALLSGVVGVALMVGMRLFLPAPPAWLSPDFVHALRPNLVLLCLLGAGFLLLLERARGRFRAAGIVLLHLTTLVLMVLGSLEFGYFFVTGSLADSFLLRYVFGNAGDVWWVLGPELHGANLVLLLAPFAVPVLAVAAHRNARPDPPPSRRGPGLGWVLAPALLLALLPGVPAGVAAQLEASSYLALARDLVRSPVWELPRDDVDEGPPFDTRTLRLVPGPDARRLNVVLVVLESQRPRQRLPAGLTPFLDALGSRALVVDEMYAVVPHTNRALVPILCGIEPRIAQGYGTTVPGACLPTLLHAHGYVSAFFTAATVGFEHKRELLAAMGYDELHGAEELARSGFERVNYFGYEDRAVLGPMLDWAEAEQRAGRPFLLTALTLTPHHPYGVPRAFPRRALAPDQPPLDRYLNTLAYVDGFLADLFAGFEARGLADSTLFVLVGDHGQAFGEHGLQFHSAVIWEEGLQVPALLVGRVVEPGRVHGPRVQTDLLPTIAELLGFRTEGGVLSGVSLLQPVPEDRTLHHATWIDNQSMALRRGSRKYVYHYRRQPLEVYDLARDRGERVNLGRGLAPREAEAVELELLRWRRRVNQRHG
jgi:arylsulfatase A-like enzyme